jgi:exonuclease V gamma subunit
MRRHFSFRGLDAKPSLIVAAATAMLSDLISCFHSVFVHCALWLCADSPCRYEFSGVAFAYVLLPLSSMMPSLQSPTTHSPHDPTFTPMARTIHSLLGNTAARLWKHYAGDALI